MLRTCIFEMTTGFGIIFETMVGAVLDTYCMLVVVVLPTFVSEVRAPS